jgi:hypothetical protein
MGKFDTSTTKGPSLIKGVTFLRNISFGKLLLERECCTATGDLYYASTNETGTSYIFVCSGTCVAVMTVSLKIFGVAAGRNINEYSMAYQNVYHYNITN